MTRKTAILTLALLFAAGTAALAPRPAMAGADGRRNTTLALGAAAVYELLQHKTANALILGAGAAYAEKQYENARASERRQRDARRDCRPDGWNSDNGQDYQREDDGARHTDGRQDDGWRDSDRHDGDNCTDRRGLHRAWDGRPHPPTPDRQWNGDRH